MPELIRLQTADFEFSVWASDISQRANLYQRTLANRASLTAKLEVEPAAEISSEPANSAVQLRASSASPRYVLRFSPAIELIHLIEPSELAAERGIETEPKICTELVVNSALFFEHTQYQFEWVFLHEVSHARLTHSSQMVNQAFRFSPALARANHVMPARLTGSINTGNDVGWLRLPLTFEQEGKTHTQHIAFEVLPTKMALHQDLPAMYQAIDQVYPLWRFRLLAKTEQDVASSRQQGHFPLMWLANFAALRGRFEQGLKVICAIPHSRLQATVANVKASKLKGRLPYKLAEQVKQDLTNGQYDKRYKVEKKQLSVDTPENRFIKMVVTQSKRQLAEFEQKLKQSNQAPDRQRLSSSFLNELHSWQQPLQQVLNQSFLNEVGDYRGLSRESLVLQQKTGYSAVYQVWQELKFYLELLGRQASISMKSVAEIYEIWCFLCLKQILEQDLGFELLANDAAKLAQNDFFEYQLKDGFAGAFCFKRADGVTARLAHEPKFTKQGQTIRSYLVNQEPDIVLEVTLPHGAGADFTEQKQFIWLFDAKYRIKTDKNRFDDSSEDIAQTDYVPDDAINQMHRYRDALIRLSKPKMSGAPAGAKAGQSRPKSRPVVGAFALYPGFFDQATEANPYASAIEEIGIGAFALLPSQPADQQTGYCGHQWLLTYLQNQIGPAPAQIGQNTPVAQMAERLYVQEAARIPYYGMRQVLYPDLTMTVALAEQGGRTKGYFEAFEQGTAQWYHLPQGRFLQTFKQHIAEEIRYLALASASDKQSLSKQINKLWPVKRVVVLPRYAITEAQAGKSSNSDEPYYLFALGKPLSLQTSVCNVPEQPIKNSMKLTTLTWLEKVTEFAELESVYQDATA